MELIHALRLDQTSSPPRIAFVGAGGKTTAMFRCARQLAGPVFVTATTHLSVEQLGLADQHYYVDDALLDQLKTDVLPGITLLTDPMESNAARAQGVSDDRLNRICALAEAHQIPLLIEADGSRQLPVKAPDDHEPAIPSFATQVVVVAGLSALGKPLTSEWVHRPEIFAAISNLELGDIITPAALTQVMTDPQGGLKNIPTASRRIALLNQADTPELQAHSVTLGANLLYDYDAVITSSLVKKSSLINHPSSDPWLHSTIYTVHQPIAAVILAAGESRRFGSTKQLLDWHGKPLVWHVAYKALQAGLNPVLVVCGFEQDAIQAALADLPVEFIHNPDWGQGQGTSVKMGTQGVRTVSGGTLFLLADQPQIPVSLMRALMDAHAQRLNPITGPMIDGQRGNPILFDRVTYDDLTALSGEVGGRKLFSKYGVDWIPWYDPSPLLDVDTLEDYTRLLELAP